MVISEANLDQKLDELLDFFEVAVRHGSRARLKSSIRRLIAEAEGGEEVAAATSTYTDRWTDYQECDYPTDVCRRCGVAVGQYNTADHDKFHAQIDAIAGKK